MRFLTGGLNFSTTIILLMFVMWGMQLALTYFQMKRFYAKVKSFRQYGITSIGMAGSFLKGRVYTVVVVDENGVIVNAEKLTGLTVFSNLKPVPDIIGFNINVVDHNTFGLSLKRKVRESFIVAIEKIKESKLDSKEVG